MYIYILIGIAALVALLLIVIATRPDTFSVTRSTTVAAPPATVFAQVNDFHAWEAWSPWAKLDPNSQADFSGPPSGKGAHFHWSGNNQVGEGAMTIVESRPTDRIDIKIEFMRPFKATNDVVFTFAPEGGQTNVSWTMSGKNNFISKAMYLVVSCDKMLGGYFEKGLASMKAVAESAGK